MLFNFLNIFITHLKAKMFIQKKILYFSKFSENYIPSPLGISKGSAQKKLNKICYKPIIISGKNAENPGVSGAALLACGLWLKEIFHAG